MLVSIIVSVGERWVIGRKGKIPWRNLMLADVSRRDELIEDNFIIVGRKTYLQTPEFHSRKRTIVVSTTIKSAHKNILVAQSIEEAIEQAKAKGRQQHQVFIVGGTKTFATALALTGRIYLTRIWVDYEGATDFFPSLSDDDWDGEAEGKIPVSLSNHFPYRFAVLYRKMK